MKAMVVKRDFTYNEEALKSYYDNLQEFVGVKITQNKIAKILHERYPENEFYNSLDRKFATLKFYGFVYFNDKQQLMFNDHFSEYIDCLKNNRGISNCFLKILLSSRERYYNSSSTNFFELLISLLRNESILYLDHIDIISYVQFYDLINDYEKIVNLIISNRSYNFLDKVKFLENFYDTHNITGSLATRVHDVNYLFSFLEKNGFYIEKNSLQSRTYCQKDGSRRKLEDKRLYLSKDLLKYINGFSYESIADEIEYNSENETDSYNDLDENVVKLVDKSTETSLAIIKRYKADRKLRNNALKKSGYSCELAKRNGEEHKTFPSRVYDGDYAEVHHLVPMHAQEDELFVQNNQLVSLDQISNLVVLCPTCHCKLHFGKPNDIKLDLEFLFEQRSEALAKNKILISKSDFMRFYNI